MNVLDINNEPLHVDDFVQLVFAAPRDLNKVLKQGVILKIDKFYNAGTAVDPEIIVYLKSIPGHVKYETGLYPTQLRKVNYNLDTKLIE